MKIAMSNTREEYPLSTNKPLKKTLAYTLWWFFLVGTAMTVTIIVSLINKHGALAFLAIVFAIILCLILFIPIYWYQKWYYAVYFYDIDNDYVRIRKGPITPKEITIPFERIQDVYVDQDILDRIFGLYDVHLSSATATSGMAAHIDGLAQPAADELKGLLLKTVTSKMKKNSP
jgi:putative membrane protein